MNNPYIRNYSLTRLTLTDANTEYSLVLSTRPVILRLHSEDLTSTFKFSFTSTGSATGEVLFQGSEWFSPGALTGAGLTLYVQSPNAGAVLQVIQFDL